MPDWQSLAIPEPNSGCWLWEGSLSRGYPRLGNQQVRRLVWGDVQPGLHLDLKCGNKLCVNPDHMFTFAKKTTSDDWRDHAIPEPMSGCWLWDGAVDGRGYGKYVRGGRHLQAHRVAYEETYGPIQSGLSVCHRSDNPLCVNPDHLFVGTPVDNMQDMSRKGRHFRSGQTHCKRGHELTPENTYYTQNKNSVSRSCKTCILEGNKRRRLECR